MLLSSHTKYQIFLSVPFSSAITHIFTDRNKKVLILTLIMQLLKHADYYEGILQLRNPSTELINYVKRKISNDQKAVISKEKKVGNGLDLYLSSQHYLQSLGKDLKKRFSGFSKTSQKLHTVSKGTGKRLYRVTVLFRLLKFKKGDLVKIGGEEFRILAVNKKAFVKNTRTGKKEQYTLEMVDKYVR